MRYAFLIAVREYVENAKTKGFWIGMLFVPLLLWGGVEVPRLLQQKASPVRYFVLVDLSGQFEKPIEVELARDHERKVRAAVQEHFAKYSRSGRAIPLAPDPAADGRAGESGAATEAENDAEARLRKRIERWVAQAQAELRDDAPAFVEPRRDYQRVPLPAALRHTTNIIELSEQLRPFLRGEKRLEADGRGVVLHAAVLIPPDVRPAAPVAGASDPEPSRGAIQYWSGNLAEMRLRNLVEQGVNAEVRRHALRAMNLDIVTIERAMQARVPFVDLSPKKERGQEAVRMEDRIRQWAPTAFVYLLWISIFSIVQMLLNNTIEEKSNRLIEVLLSSVTPGELMMGKLAGIAATGLTLVGTWVGAMIVVLLLRAGPQAEFANQALGVLRTSHLVPAFMIYFLLGFLLYASLILALGSVCNTLKEAQSYMAFITMMMMVPLLTMAFIPQDPNGTLATTLSWIPIYTPFVMLNRAAADPPLFDLIGTTVLLLLTTMFVLWASGRIFRIGILRTGQPPRLLELIRWLRR